MGVFQTVLVCEDIRDEAGNKKSLMGVLPGDITVQTLPAQVSIAFYLEYFPDSGDVGTIRMDFRVLLDDIEVGRGAAEMPIIAGAVGVLAIPRGIIAFDKESQLRFLISVGGKPEQQIISKRMARVPSDSSPSPIASGQP